MLFESFSNPFEGNFLDLANHLARRISARLFDDFDAHAARLGYESIDRSLLDRLAEGPAMRFWAPELGAVNRILGSEPELEDIPWLSAQLSLSMFTSGYHPEFSAKFATRHPLVAAGHLVHVDFTDLRCTRDRIEIRDGFGNLHLELHRRPGEGLASIWVNQLEAHVLELGSMGAAAISNCACPRYWSRDAIPPTVLDPNLQRSVDSVERSVRLLEDISPPTYLWIISLLREVVFLGPTRNDGPISQSFIVWPGHVQLAMATPLEVMLNLVHECSHLYFNMLKWCTPLVSDDARPDYSSIRKRERPFERLLLGHHAFGNTLLVLQTLLDETHHYPQDEVRAQISMVWDMVEDVTMRIRRQEHCLTRAGAHLFHPLDARLQAARPRLMAS